MTKATVMGSGSWGTAFAAVMADAGTDVTMWSRRPELAEAIDGGHIAVVLYEAVRDRIRRLRGLPPGEPVNYEKLMPLTYSIANGIGVGFIAFTLIRVFAGKAKDVHWIMWLISALFVVYFAQGPILAAIG